MSALCDGLAGHPISVPAEWTNEIADRRAPNDAKMHQRLAEDPHPMRVCNALGAIRSVLHKNPDVYVVNEGSSGESQPDQRSRTATFCGQRRRVIPSS